MENYLGSCPPSDSKGIFELNVFWFFFDQHPPLTELQAKTSRGSIVSLFYHDSYEVTLMKRAYSSQSSDLGYVWDHLQGNKLFFYYPNVATTFLENDSVWVCLIHLSWPCPQIASDGAWDFFQKYDLERLGALPGPASIQPVFHPIFHKCPQCTFARHNLEIVSCPISGPRPKLCIAKDSRTI